MEEKEEKKERYYLGEVATATDMVIVDRETKNQYTSITMLCKIANDIDKVLKSLK